MKEQLLDIIKHISSIGSVEPILVTGTKETVVFEGKDEGNTIVFRAELKKPIPEFEGVFGMRQLSLLQGLLNHPPYKADGAKTVITRADRDGVSTPEELQLFNDKGKDRAIYRFMNAKHVPAPVKLRNNNWDISFDPTDSKIQELTSLVGLYSSIEQFFSVSTVDGNLEVHFGDPNGANHNASMTFVEKVKGEIKTPMFWPAAQVLNAIKVGKGEKLHIDIMAAGALKVSMESEHATYDVIFPARKR